MNLRLMAIWVVIFAAIIAPLVYVTKGGSDQETQVVPPQPIANPSQAIAKFPTPASEPVTKLVPVPPPLKKQVKNLNRQETDRKMNYVAKNWFACESSDSFNAVYNLIRDKDPRSADHFKGEHADCEALTQGMKITVLKKEEDAGLVQIRIDDTGKTVWTQAMALADK